MQKILCFFLTLSCLVFSQNNRGYLVKIGDQAPNIDLLENYKGKVIMLQFTASWCSVCIKEMPFIEKEIWQKHESNDDFILIGLAKDTPKHPQKQKEINLMRKKTGATYPIITDKESIIFNMFAEKKAGVTRNIIIDKNGEIAFLTRLFDRKEFNEMKKIIEKLLKNK